MAKYVPKYRKRKSAWKPLYLVLILVAVAVIGLSWGTTAKYIQEREVKDSVVIAKEILFTSDLLKPESENAEYTLNPGIGGSESVVIYLSNSDGMSDGMNVSEMDVEYEVSVTENGSESDATVTYSDAGKKLPANIVDVHSVTISNLKAGKEYVVTATGSNGYKKTLTATFNVRSMDTGVYMNTKDMGEYIDLTVWTHYSSGDVKITIPNGLVPDSTDSALAGIYNYNYDAGIYVGGEFSVGSLDPYCSHVYRFFKDGYTGGNITVTVGGTNATEKATIE